MSFDTLEQLGTRTAVVRVNLLPPEIGQARKARQLKGVLGAGLFLVVAACAGAYVITTGHVTAAEDALSAEQARTAQLRAEQAPYAEVPEVLAEVQTAQSVQRTVSASNIPWYLYLDQFAAASPAGVEFTSVTMATTTADAAGTTAVSDPLQPVGAAQVTIAGKAVSQDAVAQWLDAIAALPDVGTPSLSDSTLDAGSGAVDFTASTILDSNAVQAKQ